METQDILQATANNQRNHGFGDFMNLCRTTVRKA